MSATDFKYGFRHDPLKFEEESNSLQAALVRTVVLDRPRPEDSESIETCFQDIFSKQRPDGSLDDPHEQGVLAATGEQLLRLMEMGCSPDRPEMTRAIAAIHKAVGALDGEERANISCYTLRALCILGVTDLPAVKASLEKHSVEIEESFGGGCPWTPFVQLNALWAGRHVTDVNEAIEKTLTWAEKAIKPCGCSRELGLCVPWSIILMASVIDHPVAKRIAKSIVPMMLRIQKSDGGWGEPEANATLRAFVLLNKHGLLEQLRELPPLPPDWRVVKSVPSPAENPWGLLWDGNKFWVHERAGHRAIAVSSEDGTVLKTIPLPYDGQVYPLGLWDGALTLTHNGDDRTLYKIDQESGETLAKMPLDFMGYFTGTATQIDGKLILGDHWEGGTMVIDPADPAKSRCHLSVPGTPMSIAVHGDVMWMAEGWANALICTDLEGKLLDWGESPFGNHCVAYDGKHVWALDNEKKLICAIEKATDPDV